MLKYLKELQSSIFNISPCTIFCTIPNPCMKRTRVRNNINSTRAIVVAIVRSFASTIVNTSGTRNARAGFSSRMNEHLKISKIAWAKKFKTACAVQ